jgi:CheY-like chemotaxis protein
VALVDLVKNEIGSFNFKLVNGSKTIIALAAGAETVKQNPFRTVKRVSGRLRQMWVSREETSPKEVPMPRLLIIDDEESICFSMSEYFSLHGYRVDTAQELDEAEKLIGSREYKVVIQDLRLAATRNADGLDIIKMIRGHNPYTRIIVLTAYGSSEMEDEARRCGADAFLRKPKPLSQVAQVVQGLLESPSKQAPRPA